MAISLKQVCYDLSKIKINSFPVPDYTKWQKISSPYTVIDNGYINISCMERYAVERFLKINGCVIGSIIAYESRYFSCLNMLVPVKKGDVAEFSYSDSPSDSTSIQEFNVAFIPVLTIYYIVRYNIYKLVQFLSHPNTKFGGERR